MSEHVEYYRSFQVLKDKTLPKGAFYLAATGSNALPQQLQGTHLTLHDTIDAVDRYIEHYLETLPKTIRGHRWLYPFHVPFAWIGPNLLLCLTDKGGASTWEYTPNGFKRVPREKASDVFNFIRVNGTSTVELTKFDEVDPSKYFQ